jgi:alkylation response protein AidB-like acyl-CoA dehydrogenase
VSNEEQIAAALRQALPVRGGARRVLEGGAAPDAAEWAALNSIGLSGLALPEDWGGAGFGLAEQAAAARELGHAAATAPFTAMAMAQQILARSTLPEARALAERMAAGALVGAVLPAEGDAVALNVATNGGASRLSGRLPEAFDAASLEVLLVHADGRWWAVEASAAGAPTTAAGVERSAAKGLDAARPIVSLTFNHAPAVCVGALDHAAVLALGWTLLAAEACGAAEAALDMARDYAALRRQFDQPIGRFQAIKHKLADALIQVEGARSAVHGAVHSSVEGMPQPRAARMAKAVAAKAAVSVCGMSIQTHGAIGNTWDLDLHLLLRRAKLCELALGSPERQLEAIATELVAGAQVPGTQASGKSDGGRKRPSANAEQVLEIDFDEESTAFIREFREWLDANATPERLAGLRVRDAAQKRAALRAWQARLADGGWAGIHWPKEYGGRAASFMQQVLYHTEIAVRNLPRLVGNRGLSQIGPTLIVHGTPEQKSRYVEATRRADILWASGFSEREAGSDLASLRTRGTVEGDELVITGHKIWTTSAHFADYIYVLVRTGPLTPKHAGISCVIVPANSPGLTIRPIRRMTGIADFNECLFDGVRVPVGNVVGPVNKGWEVMRTTLSHEHMTNFLGAQFKQAYTVDRVIDRLRERESTTGHIDSGMRLRVAQAWCNTQLLRWHGLRNVVQLAAGQPPGAGGSLLKVFGQEEEQRLWELAVDVLGPAGLAWDKWSLGYLSARGSTLGGGTSEIHRNKIAERVLGMPRDSHGSEAADGNDSD